MGKLAQCFVKKTTRLFHPSGAGAAAAEFYASLFPGVVVGVLFVDEDLYHERFLLWPTDLGKGEWMVYTTDQDRHPEALSCPGGDDSSVRAFCCANGGTAPAMSNSKFYRFSEYPSRDELKRMVLDAKSIVDASVEGAAQPDFVLLPNNKWIATSEFLKGGLNTSRVMKVLPAPKPAAPKVVPEPAVVSEGEPEALPMVRTSGFDGEAWLAVETRAGIEKGSVVEMRDGGMVFGGRGVHAHGGQQISVKLVADEEEKSEVVLEDGASSDTRLLGTLVYDGRGRRWLDFGKAVKEMSEEPHR